jgi:phage terminase small subunit
MPLKNGAFTPKERKFLDTYAATGSRELAEKKAGYASTMGWQVLQREDVQREIVARQVAILTSEALPAAVATVLEIMRNPKAPAAARVQAAKLTFDRVLPHHADGSGKEPHEMTPEELASAIDKLESIAAGKARAIEPPEQPAGGIFD